MSGLRGSRYAGGSNAQERKSLLVGANGGYMSLDGRMSPGAKVLIGVGAVLLIGAVIAALVVGSIALSNTRSAPAPATTAAPPPATTAAPPTAAPPTAAPTSPPLVEALNPAPEVFVFNGNAVQTRTIAADLSDLVGRTYTVCNTNGLENSVILEGDENVWVADSDFGVLYFPAGQTCCVTYSIVGAGAVQITSNPCAFGCIDVNHAFCEPIPADQGLSPLAATSFAGWWRSVNLWTSLPGAIDGSGAAAYIYIETTGNSIQDTARISSYSGTRMRPREINGLDCSPLFELFGICTKTNPQPQIWYYDGPNILATANGTLSAPSPFDGGGDRRFVLQDGGSVLIATYISDEFYRNAIVPLSGMWTRLNANEVPPIIPAGSGTLTSRSPYDPRSILESAADIALFQSNDAPIASNEDNNFIGTKNALKLISSIIINGTSHTTPIVQVFASVQPAVLIDHESAPRTTTFQLSAFPHVHFPCSVTVSGFTGAWSVLNGLTLRTMAGSFIPEVILPSGYTDSAPYPAPSSIRHLVTVLYDSSAITGPMTGSPVLTVSYGPITATTEYAETMGAYEYWRKTSFGADTQRISSPYIDYNAVTYLDDVTADLNFGFRRQMGPWTSVQTWSEVKQLMHQSFTAFLITNDFGVHAGQPSAASIYGNAAIKAEWLNYNPGPHAAGYDTTSPFHVNANINPFRSNGIYNYNIGRQNYLTNVAQLSEFVKGNTRTGYANVAVAGFYNQTGVDEYDFDIYEHGNVVAGRSNPDSWAVVEQRGAGSTRTWATLGWARPHERLRYNEKFYFGQINPAYTGGKNIGYIRITDMAKLGTQFFHNSPELAPTEAINAGFPDLQRAIANKMFATIAKYLKGDLGCTDVIIDIRDAYDFIENARHIQSNTLALRDVFGADSMRVLDLTRVSIGDTKRTVDISDYSLPNVFGSPSVLLPSIAATETTYPDITRAMYGVNATFTGAHVAILMNRNTATATNFIPNVFLGESSRDGRPRPHESSSDNNKRDSLNNGPQTDEYDPFSGYTGQRDLGGNTIAKIFGDSDARISKLNDDFAGPNSPPVSDDNFIAEGFWEVDFFFFGLQLPADVMGYQFVEQAGGSIRRPDGSFGNNLIPALRPDCTGLLGRNGGCAMPSDWNTLVYPDLGLLPNTRARLAGDSRPQQPRVIVTTGGVMSTTTGSNVVTITLPAAHGLVTGNNVGIQMLDGTLMTSTSTVGGIHMRHLSYLAFPITVTSPTAFTIETVGISREAGSAPPNYVGAAPVANATVSSAGGAIRILVQEDWRDAWLEASVAWLVAAPAPVGSKRSAMRRSKTARATATTPRWTPRTERTHNGRSTACPSGVTLTPVSELEITVNFTGTTHFSHRPRGCAAINAHAYKRYNEMRQAEFDAGHLCWDTDGVLKGTPDLVNWPGVNILDTPITVDAM